MKPNALFSGAGVLMGVCVACTSVSPNPGRAALRAVIGESQAQARSPLVVVEIQNLGAVPIAICKAALPSSWKVTRVSPHNGSYEVAGFEAAEGTGYSDSGFQAPCAEQDYRVIAPGTSFASVMPVDLFLTPSGSTPAPGTYHVVFGYRYLPSPEEASLPFLPGAYVSNEVVTHIAGGAP